MNQRTRRPDIPRPLARKLRQEVHFVCPFCNDPLLTYHHIIPWREEHHFREADMIALCLKHAHEADNKAISMERLYNAKKNPPNKRKIRDRFTIADWSRFTIAVGSCLFQNCRTVLQVQGRQVIGFTNQAGMPALFVDMHDNAGNQLLRIEENDWLVNPDNLWDCWVQGHRITVRDKSERYYIDYRVNAQTSTVSINFRIHSDGVDSSASKHELVIGGLNTTCRGLQFEDLTSAITLTQNVKGQWQTTFGIP